MYCANLHPCSSAPIYCIDVTQWVIPTWGENDVPTKLLLIIWQIFYLCADTVTLNKAWIFRYMLWQQLGNDMVSLYDRNGFGGNLDALRAHLFANIKGDMLCPPPTEDAFQLHLRRALHQFAVCKRAHLSQPAYPDAESWLIVSWCQLWCLRRQILQNLSTPDTFVASKVCVLEDAPVQEPMWNVSLLISALGIQIYV